nr:13497_t:CDS:2 [Entrophospora candida]
MRPIQFLERLSNDLTDLLNDNEDYNVLIETGEGEKKKIFKAHSIILRHRSPYFNGKLVNLNGIKEIKKNHISPKVFDIIIRYIYGGSITIEEEEPSMSLAILFVADDFGLEELANYVENYMLEVNVNYLHENFVFINKASNLKETLQDCLPLIRYFHLSSDQFFDKVFPHEKLLPTSLFKDLIQYFIIPDRPIKSSLILPPRFSTIITQRQAALIATWIDKLASSTIYNTQDNPYIFKLLLRGSRDGFRAKKFHDLCGEKSKTVVILKVQSTNEIIGGYNPIQWSKSGYGQTSESFLFSIDDNDLKNSVRSKVVNNSYALDYYSYYGPIFGGRDLALEDNFKDEKRCWCKKRYYDRAIRKVDDAFSVEDYEIFQIVPKNNNANNNYYLSNNNDSNDISSLDDE